MAIIVLGTGNIDTGFRNSMWDVQDGLYYGLSLSLSPYIEREPNRKLLNNIE